MYKVTKIKVFPFVGNFQKIKNIFIKLVNFLHLLSIPVLGIGAVQVVFALLSVIIFRDGIALSFLIPGVISICVASIFYLSDRQRQNHQVSYRHAFLFVSLTWVICSLVAAIPIRIIEHISVTDAVFESVSALTTTGATVLTQLDIQPHTFLLYRQFLQWVGGLGVVVFVVAVLPKLNVGGMKIFLAETPGPAKDEKLAPRIALTAQYLWYIYFGITLLCMIGYWISGMNLFDAIAHGFTTVSTGGFSTHDASLAYFNNYFIELNAIIFMVIGAISFTLHYNFTHNLNLIEYCKDEEARCFFIVVIALSILLMLILINNEKFSDTENLSLKAFFQLVSFITSTGFVSSDVANWPSAAVLILIYAAYIGGCAGSTAGGNKMIRNIISIKVIGRQLKQLAHPKGKFVVRYNNKPVKDEVSSATMSFMGIAAILTMLLTLLLQMTGLDFWSAFSAVAACINVLGPGFGEVGATFQPLSDSATWILSFTMLLGRLEFLTLLVIFTPAYWRF